MKDRSAARKSQLFSAVLAAALLALPLCAAAPNAENVAKSIQELLDAGYVDKAVQAAQAELAQSPKQPEVHYLLGRAFLSTRQWDRAITELESATSITPQSSLFRLWLGRAYGEKASNVSFLSAVGWAKKTRQAFERAVELDPNNLDARSDLTEFYTEAPGFLGGGTDKASAQIEKIAAADPARAHVFRARLAEKDKKYAEAEQEFRKAISTSANQPRYWLDLASYYRRRSQWNEMEKAVQSAVSSQGRDPEVLLEAAEILHRAKRNLPGAADMLRQYLASEEKNADAPAFRAHFLLGSILEQQKQPDEALKHYQATLAMAKDYQQARDALNKIKK